MNETMTTSITRIEAAFQKEHAAFMPYFTLGYPDMDASMEIVQACAEKGADLMELGMPFNDPLADGPTIQYSTQVALENGTTIEKCLNAVRSLRENSVAIPFLLMGYYNPVLAYGIEEFVQAAQQAGADGFILPDLPPEEADRFLAACGHSGMAMPFLVAPNSPKERIQLAAGRSSGFLYLVSVMGITGERDSLPPQLQDFVDRVRSATDQKLAVGFGISTPRQAQQVSQFADGVIVGSALIKAVGESTTPAKSAGEFVKAMADAIKAQEQQA